MSLYLGATGRKILGYTTSSPWLLRVAMFLSRQVGKVARKAGVSYVPGLTLATFELSQKIQPAQKIEIRSYGFFSEAGEKLADNPLGFLFPIPVTVSLHDTTPEALVKYARLLKNFVDTLFTEFFYSRSFGVCDSAKEIEIFMQRKEGSSDSIYVWKPDRGFEGDYLSKCLEQALQLIQQVHAPEALIIARDLLADYIDTRRAFRGVHSDYDITALRYASALAVLFTRVKDIELLTNLKKLILDYHRRFFQEIKKSEYYPGYFIAILPSPAVCIEKGDFSVSPTYAEDS